MEPLEHRFRISVQGIKLYDLTFNKEISNQTIMIRTQWNKLFDLSVILGHNLYFINQHNTFNCYIMARRRDFSGSFTYPSKLLVLEILLTNEVIYCYNGDMN